MTQTMVRTCLNRHARVCAAMVGAMIAAGYLAGSAQAATNEASTATVWGKYPNSLLIRTRTAATYPRGLSVFTLVGLYQDFTDRRNADTGRMENLPSGMKRRQSTFVLWGEYGFTDRFQVGLSAPVIDRDFRDDDAGVDDSITGLGDISLYAKVKLLGETRARPALTLDGFLKMPTGDKDDGLGNGETDITLAGSVSKRFDAISVHVNPEYTFTGGDRSGIGASADDRFSLNCGMMWHATPSFLPAVEWNGMWWGDVGDQQEVGCGFLWFPTKNTSIKVAVAGAVDADVPWKADWTPWIKIATWF
jgi:hypothetical protein